MTSFPKFPLLFAATLAWAPAPVMAQDLVLGLSTAKTGPYVSLASTNEIAVTMAVDEINAKGGVNGRKLKVITFDTQGDPRQAALAAQRFAADDHALAVIGPFSSSEVKVAFPTGERLGIPQMSMSSSAPGLAKDFTFAFRNTTDEGRVITGVLETLKSKSQPMATGAIAFATDDAVSKSIGTAVLPKLFAGYGMDNKGSIDFEYKAFDLSPQISKLAGMKADIVGLGTPPEASITVAKEMKRQGVSGRLIGGTTVADPDLPKRMDGAGEGMTIGTTFFKDYNPATRAFAAEFSKRAQGQGLARTEPNQMDAASYDIVLLYAEAMKQAGVSGDPAKAADERKAVRDQLRKLKDFPALEGPITFGDDGDAVKPIYVVEIKNAQWSLMEARGVK